LIVQTQCQNQPADTDPFSVFRARLDEQRVPFGGNLALTYRCNLRCCHCYGAGSTGGPELSASRWNHLLDEVADAGCLFLVMTGGEPLLSADFVDVYRHAVERGILTTVFTNATLVDTGHLELFRELPPQEVEVTVLGASPEVNDPLTGVKGSFDRMMTGVRRMLDAGVKVSLKTVAMRGNMDNVKAIQELSKGLGLRYRLDGAVFPRLDGSKAPLDHRGKPADLVRLEMESPDRLAEWKAFYRRYGDCGEIDKVFMCDAATTCFYLDPAGYLQPCVMTPGIRENAAAMGFREAWDKLGERVSGMVLPDDSPCRSCRLKGLCGYCPGFFALENGDETKASKFLCEFGQLRYDYLVEA